MLDQEHKSGIKPIRHVIEELPTCILSTCLRLLRMRRRAFLQSLIAGSDSLLTALAFVFYAVQLLGIKPDADNNEINRALNRKKYEYRLDPAMRNKLEEAHSQLMMAAFNARIRVS